MLGSELACRLVVLLFPPPLPPPLPAPPPPLGGVKLLPPVEVAARCEVGAAVGIAIECTAPPGLELTGH